MIDTPTLVRTEAVKIAVIRLTIPRHDVKAVMGPGFHEVMKAIFDQGITPLGPGFAHHFRISPGIFDFELGVPVSRAVTPVGRVVPSELPAVDVARTIYHGPYEELGNAWGELQTWIAGQGRQSATDLWEVYLTDSKELADPSMHRTELNRPLFD